MDGPKDDIDLAPGGRRPNLVNDNVMDRRARHGSSRQATYPPRYHLASIAFGLKTTSSALTTVL